MHKKLILKVFDKARKELYSKGVKAPSNHQLAIHVSDFITDEVDFSITKKSIGTYYKSALVATDSEDINISQIKVVNGLCQYLGFKNYEEFIKGDSEEIDEIIYVTRNPNEKGTIIVRPKSNKLFVWLSNATTSNIKIIWITVLVFIIGASTVIYYTSNSTRWMIWNEDHYEEAHFNQNQLSKGDLKIYKEERIKDFKKIIPNCNTVFFKTDGTENLWYGKNSMGVLEYFTDLGLHPETGKTLKRITMHMIKKHICDTYN